MFFHRHVISLLVLSYLMYGVVPTFRVSNKILPKTKLHFFGVNVAALTFLQKNTTSTKMKLRPQRS